jgi:hypothetical protein
MVLVDRVAGFYGEHEILLFVSHHTAA